MLVVVDEAYVEFVRMDDAVDGLAVHREFANVVVTRTFSKAYGLANFRVGYAMAHEDVAGALRAVSLPFGVSGVAQAAAIASLAAEAELLERVEALVAERARVRAALLDAGLGDPGGPGQLRLVPAGRPGGRLRGRLRGGRRDGPAVRRRRRPGEHRRDRGQRPDHRGGADVPGLTVISAQLRRNDTVPG